MHHGRGMEPQRRLGIQSTLPGRSGQFEQPTSQGSLVQFTPQVLNVRRIHNSTRRQLLLFNLLPDRLGKHERRQTGREFLEHAGRIRRRTILLLSRLDLLPFNDDLLGSLQLAGTKNVRMTADELRVDVARDVIEGKRAFLGGNLSVENDLDQHVAQLFAHVRQIPAVDRIDEFAHFIDQAPHQRSMGLLLIPRTTVRGPQARHGGLQFVDRAHARNVAVETPEYTENFRLCLPLLPCVPSLFMSDKLTEIMAWKRREIAPQLRPVSEGELARRDGSLPRPPSFATALRRADGSLAIIAEIKRRSPSAGDIKAGASSVEQARCYQAAGADALSVLTDEKFFGGNLDDLRGATKFFAETPPARPCLRKDFMVHPLQVLEAREAGASAILIIVRALQDDEIKSLFAAAEAAGLDALFEIHNEAELDRAVDHGARIIGVNNRDLAIFKTDLGLSERLIPLFPRDVIAVSESGISTAADAARVRSAGAHAVLVGEALMKAPDPGALITAFRTI